MRIGANTQLGIRYATNDCKYKFLSIRHLYLDKKTKESERVYKETEKRVEKLQGLSDLVKGDDPDWYNKLSEEDQEFFSDVISKNEKFQHSRKVRDIIQTDISQEALFLHEKTKYFLICDSVYKAAELIKIGENFSGRTYKDIEFGTYTYLLGKDKMVRFVVALNSILGFYYNESNKNQFLWSINQETGEFAYEEENAEIFSQIMQVLAFVELGDIEVIQLNKNQSAGTKSTGDKFANKSNYTVFVVDSSWNKLIIRTEGFAVRGHFRLQPCGPNMADRKLIWIDAFEKHGYKRRPKAEIIHD